MRVYLVYRMEFSMCSYSGYEPELECVTLTEDKAKEIVNNLNKNIKDKDEQAYYHYEDVIE